MPDNRLPDASGFVEYENAPIGGVTVAGTGRQSTGRAVNAAMTAAYWQIGVADRAEQHGSTPASYGEELVAKLAKDLTARFGRGFRSNGRSAVSLQHEMPTFSRISLNSEPFPT